MFSSWGASSKDPIRRIEILLLIVLLHLPRRASIRIGSIIVYAGAWGHGEVKMSNNHDNDSFRSRLAAADCVASIVDCIRKMRAEGLEDNEIAGLFRHAADELDAAFEPAA